MYYLFFTRYNPQRVQEQDRYVVKDQQELLEVGDYRFGDVIPSDHGILVASSPGKRPTNTVLKRSVFLPTGEAIWDIWEQK